MYHVSVMLRLHVYESHVQFGLFFISVIITQLATKTHGVSTEINTDGYLLLE